ncbi:hypothetical protein RRG08_009877 [Elysia crispata]|uniref:Uncharacterized protein n=1 Tax=Elysia crispata TaxID=231223 RepID=A0AAE0Z465_9GAST|nr:hypothetical protein RRG08_009877 [Elysia crispata]
MPISEKRSNYVGLLRPGVTGPDVKPEVLILIVSLTLEGLELPMVFNSIASSRVFGHSLHPVERYDQWRG